MSVQQSQIALNTGVKPAVVPASAAGPAPAVQQQAPAVSTSAAFDNGGMSQQTLSGLLAALTGMLAVMMQSMGSPTASSAGSAGASLSSPLTAGTAGSAGAAAAQSLLTPASAGTASPVVATGDTMVTTAGFGTVPQGLGFASPSQMMMSSILAPIFNIPPVQTQPTKLDTLSSLTGIDIPDVPLIVPQAPDPTAGLSQLASTLSGSAVPAAAPAAAGGSRPLTIAQIDDFTPDSTGFNHGQEIANTLKSGGGNPGLSGQVNLKQFSLTNGDHASQIANYLNTIIAQVQSGQTVDAVEIPQQDFNASGSTAQVQQAIQQLAALNIPVVVAAGNGGSNKRNALGTDAALVVSNTNNGAVDANSGPGNVKFQGRTTSFASANLAPIVAALHAQGQSISQIKASI